MGLDGPIAPKNLAYGAVIHPAETHLPFHAGGCLLLRVEGWNPRRQLQVPSVGVINLTPLRALISKSGHYNQRCPPLHLFLCNPKSDPRSMSMGEMGSLKGARPALPTGYLKYMFL